MSTTEYRPSIPEHLPNRLAIALWLWMWLTDRQPGEQFADLERAISDLVKRGFNAIRIDALLNWAYDQNGNVRGPVEVGNIIEPGYCENCPGLTTVGGGRVNALAELLELFRLAEKYDVYVVLTSWEFQPGHATTFVADEALRKEVTGIPADEKLMSHARKFDLLLNELKAQGLDKRVAFVEIHNEINILTAIFGGREETKAHTEEALGYLQERHPDVLFTGDYVLPIGPNYTFDLNTGQAGAADFADNGQVVDHHQYVFGVWGGFAEKAGVWGSFGEFPDLDSHMEHLEQTNEFFQSCLRPDKLSWRAFREHFTTETTWQRLIYFYENLDMDKYDYWFYRHFHEYEDRMMGAWKNSFQLMAQLGRERNLPVVCDEGYVFWPPLKSEFETSAVNMRWHDFIVDRMIEQDYWGIMVSTYTQPSCPMWKHRADWMKKVNDRITTSPPSWAS